MSYYGSVEPIRSRTQEIPRYMWDPHYTDDRFTKARGGRTIYLAPGLVTTESFGGRTVEGLHYNYSDRISQWYGYKEVEDAWTDAKNEHGNIITAEVYEAWLQRVYDEPHAVLEHIIAGVNVGNGYSYRIFGTSSSC